MPNSAPILRRIRSNAANVLFLGCIGCGTMASAALPFYIQFHPEEFGPPLMHFSGELERSLELEAQADSRRDRQVAILVKPKLQMDRITTGSIKAGASGRSRTAPPNQAYPDDTRRPPLVLDILFASHNRALVIDGGKVETVRAGSTLSNGATVEAITQTNGHWTVRTSNGAAYAWTRRD
jgi:hypothetical protein